MQFGVVSRVSRGIDGVEVIEWERAVFWGRGRNVEHPL